MDGWLRRMLGALLLAALTAAAACGRVRPLGGGPADTTPPALLSATPRDSTAGIPRRPEIRLDFSEKVDPTSVRTGIRTYPQLRHEVEVRGSHVVITFAESLPPDTTLVLVLGHAIQDEKGRDNHLPAEIDLLYSTGPAIRTGAVLGRVSVKGRPEAKAAVRYVPIGADSAVGKSRMGVPVAATDAGGLFRLSGIPPNRPFAMHAWVDRNQDFLADPDELSAAYPETLVLTPGEVRRGIEWNLVDPHEPARVYGVALNRTTVKGPVAVAVWGEPAADTARAAAGGRPGAKPPDTLAARARADTLRPLLLPFPARDSIPWAAAYAALEPRGYIRREWVFVYASPRGDYSVRVPPGQHRLAAFVDVSRDSAPGLYVLPDSTRLDWEPLWIGGLIQVGPGEEFRPRAIEIEPPR